MTKEQSEETGRWIDHYLHKLLRWKSAASLFDDELKAA